MSGPVLRPANPADSAFIAWAMDEAGDGLFRHTVGRRAPEILAAVIAQPSHSFSYEHTVIAELDGASIGVCQGCRYGTPDGLPALIRESGWLASLRAAAYMRLAGPLFALLNHREPGQWYVETLVVLPQARGAGVGSLLFADAFDRARKQQCDAVVLDVDVKNSRAVDFYRFRGLEVVSTSKARLPWDVSMHRMVATLDRR